MFPSCVEKPGRNWAQKRSDWSSSLHSQIRVIRSFPSKWRATQSFSTTDGVLNLSTTNPIHPASVWLMKPSWPFQGGVFKSWPRTGPSQASTTTDQHLPDLSGPLRRGLYHYRFSQYLHSHGSPDTPLDHARDIIQHWVQRHMFTPGHHSFCGGDFNSLSGIPKAAGAVATAPPSEPGPSALA